MKHKLQPLLLLCMHTYSMTQSYLHSSLNSKCHFNNFVVFLSILWGLRSIVFMEACTFKLSLKLWKIIFPQFDHCGLYSTVRKIILNMEIWERLWYDLSVTKPKSKPNQFIDFDCSISFIEKERFYLHCKNMNFSLLICRDHARSVFERV